jgi:methylenetetrahydrofolate dehydrogenase (NADP+) / methenyltetrahydrofolate cyclohydrolase
LDISDSKIIDGKRIAAEIRNEIKSRVGDLKNTGIVPGLAFIIVGEDPASKIYVNSKEKSCTELGFFSVVKRLPGETDENDLIRIIKEFNSDTAIHGILVQLPLPKHIDEQKVISAIDYKKDVDGFHPVNLGRLVIGLKSFIPCTPNGIIELLKRSEIETSGKNAVVIGRSNIVGKPIANLLLQKNLNCTVSVCHSGTKDITHFTKHADIIILAMGKPNFLTGSMIKDGCTIIDVGINRVEDKSLPKGYRIAGDAEFHSCYEKCSKITPVPGGVGPMTIAMLLKNTLESAENNIYTS